MSAHMQGIFCQSARSACLFKLIFEESVEFIFRCDFNELLKCEEKIKN